MGIIVLLIAVFLCLLLLLVLMLLFVPLRYEGEGDFREQPKADVHIHWCLRFFDIHMIYEESFVFIKLKLFWKSRRFSFDFNKEIEEEAEKTKRAVEKEIETPGIIDRIKDMLNRIKKAYPKFKKIAADEKNKAAVRHIRKELHLLFKLLLPKETKADAVFSTGAPDTTGQLYGAVCCLPPIYQESWQLVPDFAAEKAYFFGTFSGKGRIYGCQLAGIILRIVFDKNCQRMYTIMRKFVRFWKHTAGQEEK